MYLVYGIGRAALLSMLVAVCLLTGCQREVEKPNILLVVLDDFGYNDLALNNGSDSPTPTLDSIARQGIRFTRHYTESSCTASRVALLTGLYPARVGAHPYFNGIDHELVTLPEALREQGYTNYLIGKWHAGDSHQESRPEYQGFDHWFGFMSQLYLRGPHPPHAYKRGKPTYRNPWLEDERGEPRQYQGHLTDILTDRALEVIETERDSWFMYLSYYAPHTPIEPAPQFAGQYPADAAGRYQALIAQLDTNIGRILSKLRESGELQNTMIVVVSDNGGRARDWPSNAPFFGGKATYTEGGVRTPLLMWWPGNRPSGKVNERIAMIFDLYPTILSALGFPVPAGLDGVDLFAARQERDLRWYSHGLSGDRYGMLSGDGQWRLNNWQGVIEQLFHEDDFMQENPGNRASGQADKVRVMRESMERWIRSVTRVSGLVSDKGETWTEYSGAAFRRTPMGGTHTMGFVLQRGAGSEVGEQTGLLVAQRGYIDIRQVNDTLRVTVDGNMTEVQLPLNESCVSLVVRSAMQKSNMVYFREEKSSRVLMYLNGEEVVDATYQNAELSQASPSAVLRVYNSRQGSWYIPAESDIYLSTRALPQQEIVDQVDPELRYVCK